MKDNYGEVFRSATAAAKYDEVVYAPGSPAALINERQRTFLRDLVASTFGGDKPVQHDFACGTGRAIENLSECVVAAHGYDTSAEMIERARARGLPAEFHLVDQDGPIPEPAPANGRPAIVTMFRLFLNVRPEVRDRAVAFAAKALPDSDSGLLVIENHGNRSSLRHLSGLAKRGRDAWFNELSHDEVHDVLARHGFRIQSIRGFALLPQGTHRPPGLRPVARAIDAYGSRLHALAPYARCVLYVARRSSAGER
jgi:SAM-dependent methyltransferase